MINCNTIFFISTLKTQEIWVTVTSGINSEEVHYVATGCQSWSKKSYCTAKLENTMNIPYKQYHPIIYQQTKMQGQTWVTKAWSQSNPINMNLRLNNYAAFRQYKKSLLLIIIIWNKHFQNMCKTLWDLGMIFYPESRPSWWTKIVVQSQVSSTQQIRLKSRNPRC